MKIHWLCLVVVLNGCASTQGLPPKLQDSCDQKAQRLILKHGANLDGDTKMCAHLKLTEQCEDALFKKGLRLKARNPADQFLLDNPGMWDVEAHDERQERIDEAFKECGTAKQKKDALKLIRDISAASGGVIDWPGRCGSCSVN